MLETLECYRTEYYYVRTTREGKKTKSNRSEIILVVTEKQKILLSLDVKKAKIPNCTKKKARI